MMNRLTGLWVKVDLKGAGIAILAVFTALLGGLLTAYLPWFLVLGLMIFLAILLATAAKPHLALIFVFMLVFEVIPQYFQPRMAAGPGKLQLYDVVILLLAAVVLLRAWAQGQRPLHSLGAVRWPLYYLALCLFLSLIYVRNYAPNVMALAEVRQQIMWLVVPLMVLSVDTPKRYRVMVWSVVAIGLLVSLYVTIQSLFEIRIMTAARVEVLDPTKEKDVVRSIAGGGIYIVVFALFLILNRLIERRIHWLWGGLACFLLVAGLTVQFGRGVWIATAAGLLISAGIFRGVGGVVRTALAAAVVVAVTFSAAWVVKPRLAEAAVARLSGIGTEFRAGESFGWRLRENDAALARIEKQPLTGVGIGGEYKQTTSAGGFNQETTYIHNGYLYFPLKMGVFASLVPFAFIVAFIMTLRQANARHLSTADPAFVAALCGAFAVPVITSGTQPEWTAPQGIAAYAILTGLALLYRLYGAMPGAQMTVTTVQTARILNTSRPFGLVSNHNGLRI